MNSIMSLCPCSAPKSDTYLLMGVIEFILCYGCGQYGGLKRPVVVFDKSLEILTVPASFIMSTATNKNKEDS